MKFYQTQAIVLKRKNTKEADKILTFYTKKYGKLIGLAKGIKKISSKLAGHLEPFYLIQLTLVEGKTFKIVSEAKTINSFKSLRSNLERTSIAYFISEIVDKLMGREEKNEELFYLLKKTFEFLEKERNIDLVLPYFEFNFLSQIGFRPDFNQCVRCQKKIKDEKEIYFSFKDGGLIDKNCQKGSDFKISPAILKFLKLSERLEIDFLKKIKSKKPLVLEIENLLTRYLEFISEKKFKSKIFLKKVQKKI